MSLVAAACSKRTAPPAVRATAVTPRDTSASQPAGDGLPLFSFDFIGGAPLLADTPRRPIVADSSPLLLTAPMSAPDSAAPRHRRSHTRAADRIPHAR